MKSNFCFLNIMFWVVYRTSQHINYMANPLAHSWLKPNIQQNPSSESRGPINLLTNSRSSHDIPDVITGHLSRNDKEKKLKGNGNVEPTGGCLPKSISSNSKVQSTTGSGDPPQPTRRQVNSIHITTITLDRISILNKNRYNW